ncbi:MAG: T9SS type A sorting domain-containing protein [Bacteroidetes bacterium]|nr:T9SS type A sorting domain-containing protein [Bacteroidota bacterium]
MKDLIAICFLVIPYSIYAQLLTTVSFENNSELIRIDTSDTNNIWQIGIPQKQYLNTAYSPQFAIVTDTINPYPNNNLSKFELTIEATIQGWGQGAIPILQFYHRYDTDSLQDGGYIEVSYDGGLTWINISDDNSNIDPSTCTINPAPVISGGQKAFTGRPWQGNEWLHCTVTWNEWCFGSGYPDTIDVRFVFQSDSTFSGKEGWLIDEIVFGTDICSGIEQFTSQQNIKIYPNPSREDILIELDERISNNTFITLHDVLGKDFKTGFRIIGDKKLKVLRNDLPPGIYLLKVINRNKAYTRTIIFN